MGEEAPNKQHFVFSMTFHLAFHLPTMGDIGGFSFGFSLDGIADTSGNHGKWA